jgi:hypothetical protein
MVQTTHYLLLEGLKLFSVYAESATDRGWGLVWFHFLWKQQKEKTQRLPSKKGGLQDQGREIGGWACVSSYKLRSWWPGPIPKWCTSYSVSNWWLPHTVASCNATVQHFWPRERISIQIKISCQFIGLLATGQIMVCTLHVYFLHTCKLKHQNSKGTLLRKKIKPTVYSVSHQYMIVLALQQ